MKSSLQAEFGRFLADFARFIVGRGSRPHPDNILESLARRSSGQPVAVVTICLRNVQVARAVHRRGRWVLDMVTVIARDLAERGLADALTPDVLNAIKERSPRYLAVVGVGVKVNAKMLDECPADVIAAVKDGSTVQKGGSPDERVSRMWHEGSGRMVRHAIEGVQALERILETDGCKLLRLDITPFVLLNAALGYAPSTAGSSTRRMMLVLDEALVQAFAFTPDGGWAELRAVPIFSPKAVPGASFRADCVEALKGMLESMFRHAKGTDHEIELVVMDTLRPAGNSDVLTEALAELAGTTRFSGAVKLTTLNSEPHLDLHALLLHP